MASIQITTVEDFIPTIARCEMPRAYALLKGYIAIIQYKSNPQGVFDNFGCCTTEEQIAGYLSSPYCHDPECLFDARSDFSRCCEALPLDASTGRTLDDVCRNVAAIRREWDTPGNFERAEEMFREIVNRNPSMADGHYGLGELLIVKADRQQTLPPAIVAEGLVHIHQATRLDPWHTEALLKLANKLCGVNYHWGETLYKNALRAAAADREFLYPLTWQAGDHWQVAMAAADHGTRQLALDAFRRAIRLDEKFAGHYMPSSQTANAVWQEALRSLGKTDWFEKRARHDQEVWNVLHGGSMFSQPQIVTCTNPACCQQLRVPNPSGRIRITCPKCKQSFFHSDDS